MTSSAPQSNVEQLRPRVAFRPVNGVDDVRIALGMAAESAAASGEDFNAEVAWATLIKANWGMFATVDGKIAGVVLAAVEYNWHNWNIVARELFFYVKPEYRGLRLNYKLLELMREWSKTMKATRIKITLPRAVYKKRLPTMIKGMERAGFKVDTVLMASEV